MRPNKTLGLELHTTSNLLDRRMNAMISAAGADGITPMHGMFLAFCSRCREQGREVYQRDMEAEFDVARSTVTATLQLMERKGYILREGVAHDARLKRIILTPLGHQALEQVDSCIQRSEALLRDALTAQEHGELMRLLDKLKAVLY